MEKETDWGRLGKRYEPGAELWAVYHAVPLGCRQPYNQARKEPEIWVNLELMRQVIDL